MPGARATAPRSRFTPAGVATTRSGASTPTARSWACSPGCALTPSAAAPATAQGCSCTAAGAAATRSGPTTRAPRELHRLLALAPGDLDQLHLLTAPPMRPSPGPGEGAEGGWATPVVERGPKPP